MLMPTKVIVPFLLLVMSCLSGCAYMPKSGFIDTTTSLQRSTHVLLLSAQKAYAERNWPHAQSHYSKLIKRMPDNAQWRYRLGNSLAHQGEYAEAITSYESSLSLDINFDESHLNLATTYLLGAHGSTLQALEVPGISDHDRAVMEERLLVLESLLD